MEGAIKTLQSALDKINILIDKRISSSVPVIQSIVDNFEAPINLCDAVISTSRVLQTPPSVLIFKRQEAPSFSGRPKSAVVGLTKSSSSASQSHLIVPKKNTEIHAWLFNDLIILAEKLPESSSDSKTHRLLQIITVADFISGWSDSRHPNVFGIDFCSTRWIFTAPSIEVRGEWLRGLHLLKETQQNQLFSLK